MSGFAGSYSHTAGDRFIFKGGVTWPNACFTMTIGNSGVAGGVDYYGVDRTWFTGGAWSRPVFNAGGAAITGGGLNKFINMMYVSYVQIDDIEFTGFYWDSTCQTWPNSIMIHAYSSAYCSWTNCYFHNWSHGAGATSENGYGIVGNTTGTNAGTVVDHCIFDGSSTSDSLIGAIYGGIETVRFSTFHDLLAGPITYGNSAAHTVHDCVIYNIAYPFDGSAHPDGIYFWGAGSCYNNIVHDVKWGMAIDSIPSWEGNTGDVLIYNNVVWNFASPGNGPITLANEVGNYPGTERIFNNTLQGGAGATGPAIRIIPSGYVVNAVIIENNHFITSFASPAITVDGAGSVTTLTADSQLLQTAAQAAAEGYDSSSLFAPTATGSTVDTGVSRAAYFGTDMLGVSRPQGSAWDIGAYEFQGAAKQAPPRGLRLK